MNKVILANLIRFLGLLLLQVLILDEIELHGFVNPYIYPLFILLLPLSVPHWLQLILGFAFGLLIDFYANTLGFHAAATVWLAFIRPYILRFNEPRGGYEPEHYPVLGIMGFRWTILYVSMAILLHHIVLFFIEISSFSDFQSTFFKIFLSTGVSIMMIMLYQFVVVPKR